MACKDLFIIIFIRTKDIIRMMIKTQHTKNPEKMNLEEPIYAIWGQNCENKFHENFCPQSNIAPLYV